MVPEKLNVIKTELQALSPAELLTVCLGLIKYKKENKELVTYLLFHAHDNLLYTEKIKKDLEDQFKSPAKSPYASAKSLRKVLAVLGRYTRFTGSKQVEADLLLWFCKNFMLYADIRSSYKPLIMILVRQLQKLDKIIGMLHEDIQTDFKADYEQVHEQARAKARNFNNLWR